MRFACAVSSRTFSVKPLSGQEAASSCLPLALERGLSAALSVAAAGGRSFSCARFVELRRPSGSWRLEAGPGWVGLRSKLLMSFELKKSTS